MNKYIFPGIYIYREKIEFVAVPLDEPQLFDLYTSIHCILKEHGRRREGEMGAFVVVRGKDFSITKEKKLDKMAETKKKA